MLPSPALTVSDACIALGLRAVAILFRDLSVAARSAWLHDEIIAACRDIQQRFATPQQIRSTAEVARFRSIHKQVAPGLKKPTPSVENLYRYALKRGDLPRINNLVDAYNLVSLRSRCSMGAHDVARITLPIELAILDGTEPFTPLGSTEPAVVSPGEFGYVDDVGRLLCRLDVVQADFSKVTAATHTALVIIESTDAHPPDQIRQAFEEVVALVHRECGGSYSLPGPQ